MMTARFVAFAVLNVLAAMPAASAMEMDSSAAAGILVRVDWQTPLQLPPRFRNHCAVDSFSGRPFCSNHCGSDYQFYYCSSASFGCCHIGHGYCARNELLRCTP
jgi:hypothetical protein